MSLLKILLNDEYVKQSSIKLDLETKPILEDETEYKRRISICNSCEELNSLKICKKCWCYMPAKAALVENSCVLNKH